ncbi:MAG: hypothetical protein BGP25_07795 [Lysobacterales bacterium 63-13]|nr:MAG: hypothetical protein BGP25_07795 [Xanthomonadales bacterium 63-13]
MADLQIKNIDPATQERMRDLALQRGWSINEFALRALRYVVGLSSEHPGGQDRQDIATMRGVWNQIENQAFREAIEAFREVESGPTFESPDKSGK